MRKPKGSKEKKELTAVNKMVELEYNYLADYLTRHNKNKFSKKDIFELSKIHNRLFEKRVKLCKYCDNLLKELNNIVKDLKRAYETIK